MKAAFVAALALAITSQASEIDETLLFGRDALEAARAEIRAEDTYSGFYQPRSDVVFVRDYDAKTGKPLFTAALVNDKKSQKEAKNVKKAKKSQSKKKKTKYAHYAERSVNPDTAPAIFARASRCGQYCSNRSQCTVSPTCPRCVHGNRVKPSGNDWQKVCGP